MIPILIRILVILAVIWLVQRFIKNLMAKYIPQPESPSDHGTDPYTILEVSKTASMDEIKDAYKKALAQYHPDKVSHLGQELQDLAAQKTKMIVEAYDQLQKTQTP